MFLKDFGDVIALFFILSQIFSASPQILKVNKESTFYLHREIFILRMQLFSLHGKSRNPDCLLGGMEWTPNVFPWNSLTCHKTNALSSPEKSPPAHPVDTLPPVHLLTFFPLPRILLGPISNPRASPTHHTKASLWFQQSHVDFITLVVLLSLKITLQKRLCLTNLWIFHGILLKTLFEADIP